jgi:phospholipid transport system transporter-binding protein
MDASPARLEGELCFSTVRRFLAQAEQLAASGTLDLSGVSRADSAGLALLLELDRLSRARGAPLELRGASEQVRRLAAFFGLDSILRFDTE